MLAILPIHSLVFVPIFLQMWTCMLILEHQKREIPIKINAYALNTPLFLTNSEINDLEEGLYLKNNSLFEVQDEDFV